jgi:hypothetical protein
MSFKNAEPEDAILASTLVCAIFACEPIDRPVTAGADRSHFEKQAGRSN